jgi:predicted NAD/FAD-dependent oxidoreductase
VVVVGAGVSGLACAAELARAGSAVVVLERARGVGGRCATRRLEGQAFDMGPAFLHGQDPDFLRALREVPARRIEGWPREIQGTGRPCQPEAFRPGEQRLAYGEGLTAFPKHLARDLDVRIGSRVTGMEAIADGWRLGVEGEEPVAARHVVLALAAEQVLRLLPTDLTRSRPLASLRALLEMSASEPSLALAAAYPAGTPVPAWQLCLPEGSSVLQVMSHDSSKRESAAFVGLVLQARPAWSRIHVDDPEWSGALLAEAGRLAGDWAARPSAVHAHRWSFARSDLASELAAPMLLRMPSGGTLGVCGDRFARGGGVEAAWISGRELGRRIAAQEAA